MRTDGSRYNDKIWYADLIETKTIDGLRQSVDWIRNHIEE